MNTQISTRETTQPSSTATASQAHAPENGKRANPRPTVAPAVDVYENEDQLLIVADVPGVPTDGFNLSFENGTLRLEAKRPAASGEHAAPALAREYEEVDYAATFRVPAAIDTAQIAAESKAGTILIRLPKAAAAKPRKITVS